MNKTSWLAAALLLCMTPMASASVTVVSNSAGSTSNLGSFTSQWDYNAGNGRLTIDITNTSATASRLVAFVLNLPTGATGVSLFSTNSNLTQLMGGTNNSVSANPFADFDFGVVLQGNANGNNETFEAGGGNPNDGIGVGSSGNFVFQFTGAGVGGLTTSSFINAVASDGKFFAARFKAFANGGSDKVPGTLVVPEPASIAVWGCVGLMGIPYGIYRRRKAVTA